ncbi:MAG: metallophosphoesterase [Brooklawnia sp.]|jgi:predicted MPP superfamily phosphohydrolase
MSRTKLIGGAAAALTGLGATVAVGAWVEAQAFLLRRVTVPVLPAGQRDIRVLHISDIHLMPYQRRKLDFISKLAGLQPDLVISTGDNASSPDTDAPLVDALGDLLKVPGVFVFGSNDFVEPRFRNPLSYLVSRSSLHDDPNPLPWWRVHDAFLDAGWRYLDNQAGRLQVAGRVVDFRGTGDAHMGLDNYASLAGPSAPDADLTIGVTHSPYRRVLDAMTTDGLDMIFAGHTHGGQVCLPVNRALTTNCDLPLRQASGLSSWTAAGNTVPLHVSAGIGTNPFVPLRLFCRPEATLLRLVAVA